MPDVLFVKTSSLGDVIHHMPALTEAHRNRPGARFSWVVEEAYAPLVRLHPAVSDVIAVASRRWRKSFGRPSTFCEVVQFRRHLRSRAYDTVIDSQGLVRSALIARMARGRRHGFDAGSVREKPAFLFYHVTHAVARNRHAIERNRMLTARALGYEVAGDVDFGLDRAALALPAGEPSVVFLHATARPEKEWPEARWIELGRRLQDRGLAVILPWGTEAEEGRSRRIGGGLAQALVPPRAPLDAVARMIAGASVVVGVDTGLLHLAAALGVPLAAIFTATDPALTGPVGRGAIRVLGRGVHSPDPADVEEAVVLLLDQAATRRD